MHEGSTSATYWLKQPLCLKFSHFYFFLFFDYIFTFCKVYKIDVLASNHNYIYFRKINIKSIISDWNNIIVNIYIYVYLERKLIKHLVSDLYSIEKFVFETNWWITLQTLIGIRFRIRFKFCRRCLISILNFINLE